MPQVRRPTSKIERGDLFSQALALDQRYNQSIAILFIDLDEFKPINDTYGYAAGDKVLQEVALRLRNVIRKSDSRYLVHVPLCPRVLQIDSNAASIALPGG
ncbi:GGDEF domain-containing protein [Undibacterium sp. Ji50W]|uniref:GGDEF domain-containing protein n=1 Tax=Undibacterium sp. Ji50W TaxID=3413041 RepID=UPI003BF156AC